MTERVRLGIEEKGAVRVAGGSGEVDQSIHPNFIPALSIRACAVRLEDAETLTKRSTSPPTISCCGQALLRREPRPRRVRIKSSTHLPMQFIMMVYKNQERFAALPDSDKRLVSEACDTWYEKLQRTGQVATMTRLHGTATAATVRKSEDRFLVIDGPFAETKEVFGGFAILECRDRTEAVELAKTFPGVEVGFAMEVRPIVANADAEQCWRQP
jgi:hypothetical protein